MLISLDIVQLLVTLYIVNTLYNYEMSYLHINGQIYRKYTYA